MAKEWSLFIGKPSASSETGGRKMKTPSVDDHHDLRVAMVKSWRTPFSGRSSGFSDSEDKKLKEPFIERL